MTTVFGAQGAYPSNRNEPTTVCTLQPGQVRLVPAGTWLLSLDGYSTLQEYDPVQVNWVNYGGGGFSGGNGSGNVSAYVNSDGNNYRLVNASGCVVGTVITTAGSGYTAATAPTVSFSAGGAVGFAVVGGLVSTSVTVTNGGTNYTYPPQIYIDPPPAGSGGLQATGYATLTSGAVSSITIDNQGAGYTNVPQIYIQNDARDTTGNGASATLSLTGAGTITNVAITNHGTPLTTIPSITFSSGSAAATPIMVRSIGAYTVGGAGSGYSGTVEISALGTGLTATSASTNPKWTSAFVRTRKASIIGGLSSGALTTSGQVLLDGGIYAGSSPTYIVYGTATGTGASSASVGFTWTNQNSTISLQPV